MNFCVLSGCVSFVKFGSLNVQLCSVLFCLSLFAFFRFAASAQTVSIPAYTGYAVPADRDESPTFSEKNGLHWTNVKQTISYFFYVRKAGELLVSIDAKNAVPGSAVKLSVAGKVFTVNIPSSKIFKTVKVGSVTIKDSGFYTIEMTAIKKAGTTVADMQSIQLSGPAADIHF